MNIKTDRLLIRSLRQGDAEPLAELWSDPEVTEYLGGPRDYHAVQKDLESDIKIHEEAERDGLWPVLERETETLIGHCGLLEKEVDGERETELVYVIAKKKWGMGYATEASKALMQYAFHTLGLRHLISLIDPGNAKSEKVAAKLGMTLEKESLRPTGRRMKVYGIHAEDPDWERSKR